MASSPSQPTWQEIASLQAGVISERDARSGGLTLAEIRARLATGVWRQPTRGVLVTTAGPLPRVQREWAAVLAGGPGAVLGGATAAALDGLAGHPDETVTVLIPAERRCPPIDGVAFRRTARLSPADVHRTRLPPRTVPARSVIDLAEWSPDRARARAVVVDALCQGFVTFEAMRRALAARGPIIRRTLIGATLDELDLRTPLVLARLHRQIESVFALPTGRVLAAGPPDLPTGRLDVWYGPQRLLVRIGQQGPHRRHVNGRRVLVIPAERLWQEPAEVAALVTAALGSYDPARPAEGVAGVGQPDGPAGEWPETVRDELGEGDQGGGGGIRPAVASRQMRELPPWEAERAAGQEPVPPTA